MRAGDSDGMPHNLKISDDEEYDATDSKSKFKPLQTKGHPEVPYFNKCRLMQTIECMKDLNQYPVACKARDMPNGVAWNNFPTCLRMFATIYSAMEGHTKSSPEANSVESFVFHNHYTWHTRRKTQFIIDGKTVTEPVKRVKPFVFFVHKKMVSGRARFAHAVEENFEIFIRLVQQNKTWVNYLADQGKGNPPMQYLIAFEEGLRNYAKDPQALGMHALRSPEHYGKIAFWRKREAYIALGRYLLRNNADYKQWDCYLFRDHVDRLALGKTYNERHHPLSDGNDKKNFKNKFKFPWEKYKYNPRPRTRVKSERTTVPMKIDMASDDTPKGPMVYDLEKGCLVPFE